MIDKISSLPLAHRFMFGGTLVLGLLILVPGYKLKAAVVIGCILITFFIWLFNLLFKGIRRKKASAFDKGLQANANKPGMGKAESRKAVSEVAQRWNQAISELKAAGLSLYDLPWYLLIGEPQSGKSTTLRNSGLEFPVGTEALSGAGGTRNCDWWFTNEAVILDTAGRFTFQEKNAPDAEEWKGFLQLLKKNRSACPINGVVLTIPATSLLSDSDEERENKARNIREKLTQIQRELEVQFPVFILITKSDQILGFTEFFSRLGATEQRQLLGWSMHGPFIQAYNADSFHDVFQKIFQRVHKWRLKLLGEDVSLTEIDKLYVFPEEFKSLEGPLHDYLKSIFVKTQLLQPLFFRGFYFTSGLQQGKPVARACAQMLRNAGAGAEEIIDHLQKIFERSRAFFIRDFYLEKLFPERNLIIHSVEKLGVSRKLARVAIAASAVLMLATLGFITWRAIDLRKGVAAIDSSARKVKDQFLAEVERTRASDAKPQSAEEAADSVKLAVQFKRDAIAALKKMSDLRPYLREMAWLYFLQNCLQDQGRALYAELAKTPAGASLKDPVRAQYAAYARLWSLNVNWLAHARTEKGPFTGGKEIEWPAMLQQGITKETQEAFQKELSQTKNYIAGDDLLFNKAPIVLPLIAGNAKPDQNEVISKEIEAVRAGFKPVENTTVQQLVGTAKSVRDIYGNMIDGVMKVPCGYSDPPGDRFAGAREAIGQIRKAIGSLDGVLAANKDVLRSMASDPKAIEGAFKEMTWTQKTVEGPARTDLNNYIKGIVREITERMSSEAAKNRQPLAEVGDVIVTSDTLTEHEALLIASEGLTKLEALADEQNKTVARLAGEKIPNPDEAKKEADKWAANAARLAALQWAQATAKRIDAPPAWKLVDLARAVEDAVKSGDEAVLVEAWLAYLRTTRPGVLLSRNQVSAANLTDEPPSGARPDPVFKANDDLARLAGEIKKFKEGLTCDSNGARLLAQLEAVEAIIKENQANFVAYWRSAYRRWEPAAWIESIATWEAFKTAPIMQATALSQRVKSDLQRLVANVQGYKDKGGSLGDLGPILSDLQQFTTPASPLEQNVNLFSDTVGELDLNKLQASIMLQQPGASGQVRNKAIDVIATRSSSLNGKFEYYPKKVRALLEVGGEFQLELGRFLARWFRDLGGRFPFAVDPADVKVASTSVAIPQVNAKKLHEFYFGPDSLPAFIKKYGALYDKWAAESGHEAVRDFFNQSLALRDYFFDAQGAYKPIKIEGTYTGFDGKRSEDLREISERIDLLLPTPSTQAAMARWRSQVPGSLTSFTWSPGDYGNENVFIFRSMLDRGENPNKAELKTGGDYSVLAYIVTQCPGPEADRRRWAVKFGVTPEGDKQNYKVSFIFVFDRGVPRLPDWAAVRQWTK